MQKLNEANFYAFYAVFIVMFSPQICSKRQRSAFGLVNEHLGDTEGQEPQEPTGWWFKLKKPFYPPSRLARKAKGDEYTEAYSRDKDYLFKELTEDSFSPANRSRIVEFILQRPCGEDDEDDDISGGIDKLISEGVYTAAYPLHYGSLKTEPDPESAYSRFKLSQEWASWRCWWKFQPLDAIRWLLRLVAAYRPRDYYGVKIGMYFAWLGYYTGMLVPPSLVRCPFLSGIESTGGNLLFRVRPRNTRIKYSFQGHL